MRVFVTGADTDVGKTVASTVLAVGLGTHYWKPVQTGSPPDADFVGRWIPREKVIPERWRFPLPASPHLAAAASGATIDFEGEIAAPAAERLVIEGAGGVLVPLNEKFFVVDLIRALNVPAIVVVRPKLGVINHALLTFEALRTRSIAIRGFISSGEEEPEMTTSIARYGDVAHLGHLPQTTDFTKEWFHECFRRLRF